MAKLICALLALALIASPFLNAMQAYAAGRIVSGGTGEKDPVVGDRGKVYGSSKWFWWGIGPWGLGWLHPWLIPPPIWWLKDGKTKNPNYNPKVSSDHINNGHESTSEVTNFAPASHSP